MQTGIDLRGIPDSVGFEKLMDRQTDIVNAQIVNVKHDVFTARQRIWVNVNGVCVLRTVSDNVSFDLKRIERLEQALVLVKADLEYGVAIASDHNAERAEQMSRRLAVVRRVLEEVA